MCLGVSDALVTFTDSLVVSKVGMLQVTALVMIGLHATGGELPAPLRAYRCA